MAQADWTLLTPVAGGVRKGVTAGVPTPPSIISNDFLYAFNSIDDESNCVALHVNGTGFVPTAKGGYISAVFKRGESAAPAGFSPFLFISASGTTIADVAYVLGLSDENPYHIVLLKGALANGAPGGLGPGAGGVLLRSDDSYAYEDDLWHHLRLMAVKNTNGDVVLSVQKNDIDTNQIGQSPVWANVPGMEQFIDDVTEINTGSAPYAAGFMGYGFQSTEISRRVYFDQIIVASQN